MGFIDKLFGSKKEREEEKEVLKTEEQKAEAKKTDENELVLEILKEKLSDMNLKVESNNEMVLIPENDTSIRTLIAGKTQQENGIVIHINFHISNNELGEEGIYESLAGVGKGNDVEEAIGNCLDAFLNTVFKTVYESLQNKHTPDLDIETNFKGDVRQWNVNVGSLQSQGFADSGDTDNNRIFNLLKDEIKKLLKNKRYYWIKVFLSKQLSGKLMFQCLLNNKPFYEAERILGDYVKDWPENKSYMAQMQYIIIRQSDKSWNENREKDIENDKFMKSCAEYAISVFENFRPEDSVEGLVNKIAEFTKDINLAWEFFWFIPAIYCRMLLRGPKYTDTVVLVLPDDRRIFRKLYDYEAYVVGVDAVIQSLQTNEDKEKIQKVLFLSEEFKSLQQAVSSGNNPENLQSIPMVLMAPLSYIYKD
ncbi:MAG: hypothetical protein BWY74_01330 [Firmicutes bacterium ADurb.Bin419]|nr:MAG: hypothetical protein BWY74_01330 [Firmicutes bacterium ADurb.Bin419]